MTTNADSAELLRQLEQATSYSPGSLESLDEETRQLRENWLMLSRLLQASEPVVPVVELANPPRAVSRRQIWERGGVCLSVVLILSAVWWATDRIATVPPRFETARFETARSESTTVGRKATEQEMGIVNHEAARVNQLAWDDHWEDQLAETALTLQGIHRAASPRDLAITQLEHRFQELAREFETNSL